MKKCSKCGELKSLDSFHKMASCFDGLYPSCKSCKNEKDKTIRRTIRGVVTELYKKQRWSSKKRRHNMPEYSKEEFRKWLYSQPLFFELYNNWVSSEYDKNLTPSVDRINSSISYKMSNIQLMTWHENNIKGSK